MTERRLTVRLTPQPEGLNDALSYRRRRYGGRAHGRLLVRHFLRSPVADRYGCRCAVSHADTYAEQHGDRDTDRRLDAHTDAYAGEEDAPQGGGQADTEAGAQADDEDTSPGNPGWCPPGVVLFSAGRVGADEGWNVDAV